MIFRLECPFDLISGDCDEVLNSFVLEPSVSKLDVDEHGDSISIRELCRDCAEDC